MPEGVLAFLLKKTNLQINYHFNVVTIARNTPVQLGLKAILEAFLQHRRKIVLKRSQHDHIKKSKRLHEVEGLIRAVDVLDAVIAWIRASKDKADALYDRYIVPTPGKVYWDGVIGPVAINFKNPARPPLLLIAGEIDLIADASMTRAIFAKQRQAPSKTEYKEFAGRSHWTCVDDGWEAVADYALDFAVTNARASTVTPIRNAA